MVMGQVRLTIGVVCMHLVDAVAGYMQTTGVELPMLGDVRQIVQLNKDDVMMRWCSVGMMKGGRDEAVRGECMNRKSAEGQFC